MESTATQRFFETPAFLQLLFDQLPEDPSYHLQFRLVNKLFNTEFLHLIRKSHKTLTFRHVQSYYDEADNEIIIVAVNERAFELKYAKKYFKFLLEVVGVKVNRFFGRKLNWVWIEALNKEERTQLHEDVLEMFENRTLKTFIGMEDLCPTGCSECSRHALEAREYGPVQWSVFKDSFKDLKRHYDKLIVWDGLLNKIALESMKNSISKAECLNFMKSLIPSNISCDTLCFVISEFPWHEFENAPEGKISKPMPREVIEELCRVWKVKSIEIRWEYFTRHKNTIIHLETDGFFTGFRFEDPFHLTNRTLDLSFEQVNLHIHGGVRNCCGVFNSSNDTYFNYNNLIANARRVFPTNKLRVYGCTRWKCYCERRVFNEPVLTDILSTVWKDNLERNLEVTVRFFPNVFTDITEQYDFPKEHVYGHRSLSISVLPTVNHWTPRGSYPYIGRTFRVTDNSSNCVVNLELFVKEWELENAVQKDGKEKIADGYLKHFL